MKKNQESHMQVLHKKKTSYQQAGFTLIELLAVIVVFVAVGGIIVAIITAVLRGNNKTNTLNSLQANGDYAISQMTKSMRNATTLLSPFPCGVINTPTATTAVQLAFPDGSVTTFSCKDSSNAANITSNSASLINTNAVTVTACSFTCGQNSPSDYPIIGINFSLQAKNANSLVESTASLSAVQFQTSIVIRNLIR